LALSAHFASTKSHYPDLDMAKVKAGADVKKDLGALELEV
jgi:hypothetical protein